LTELSTGTFTSTGIDDNATSTAITIDANENVLIGKTTTNFNTDGFQAFSGGFVHATATQGTANSGTVITVNRKSTDGSIVDLKKDGSTVGSIATRINDLVIGTGDVAVRFSDGGNAIIPADTLTGDSDNAIDLGASGSRFKDLYLSGGVVFGDAGGSGSSTSNTLDSYEEGTWTPIITGSTTAGTHSSIIRGGEYIKVGNKVTVIFYYGGSSGTGSGELRLSGLPFTIAHSEASGVPFANAGLVFNSGWSPMWMAHSTTEFKIRAMSPTGGSFQAVAYPTYVSYLRGTLTYITDD
jgi:hypothetical protein